jgi:hypothetical protein
MELVKTQTNHSDRSVFAQKGEYLVNVSHLDVCEPVEQNIFVYRYAAGAQFNVSRKLQNDVICGLVALTEDPNSPGDMMLAPNATLINKGIIDIHFKDLYAAHVSKQQQHGDTYHVDALRGYAMAAGENSVLVNEGVINMYMDQDMDADATIYCCAMWAEANSILINKGEIHFYGNGSWQALVRGVGGVANYMQVINEGLITVDVQRAFQTRILHSAGMFGSLWNKGHIHVKVAGRIMTMGSVTGTHMMNDGEIDVTSIATLIEGKIPYLFNFPPMATGMYEHFRPGDMLPSPIINRGSIKVHLVGSEASGPDAIAFGFYYQMENEDHGETPMRVLANEGIIQVTQEGPKVYTTAEVGVNMQLKTNNPIRLKVKTWKTSNRDFASKHDLFTCHSAQFDFADAKLLLTETDKSQSIPDAEQLIYQTPDAQQRGDSCKIINKEGLKVEML